MLIKSRYDIITGKPGRIVHKIKPKGPPDVSFLSDDDFIKFVQEEIKRREEKNNTVFTNQLAGLTGIGTFVPSEQAEAIRLSFAGVTGYTGIQGYRGYAGVTGYTGIQGYRGYAGVTGYTDSTDMRSMNTRGY